VLKNMMAKVQEWGDWTINSFTKTRE